eukprot:CAMPEP_0202872082 /NCGR_PEP_ID=MMETSP1391-20130828/20357_1 /ASSEMBLY_ACC=CAM_ASM_000867 /TAXON_ID=1034604 /ORGANISM="Chlamydomonas leiostraca, Strain SAG 11-49" /LENGTH=38 /DNA_ID= /DNA_START= /DNA_END= /DNA_ORIENTATION=
MNMYPDDVCGVANGWIMGMNYDPDGNAYACDGSNEEDK